MRSNGICSPLASSNSRVPQEQGALPTISLAIFFPRASQMMAFVLARRFVPGPRLSHTLHLRDFGDGHVPPGFVTRHPHGGVGLHHDDGLSLIHISEPTRLGMK